MRILSKLDNLGASPNDIHRYHKDIEKYNLNALRNYSVMMVLLLVVVILVAVIFKMDTEAIPALVLLMAFSGIFAVISHDSIKSNKIKRGTTYILLTVYSQIVYFITLYLGVFNNREEIGTLFVMLLIASQIIYITPVSWNFTISFIPMVFFCIGSFLCKTPDIAFQDMRNVCVAFITGLFLNYINSREKMQLIIANGKLSKKFDALTEASETDPLTGLLNKRVSQEKLTELCRECANSRYSVFAAIIDVDFFKKYNDTYGHLRGDEVLMILSNIMKELAAEYGILAGRVGGEEFLLCGVVGSRLQASRICDRLRYAVQSRRIEHKLSEAAPFVTISVGVMFIDIGDDYTGEEIYECADKALYEAKRAGRNCVKTYI